MTDAEALEIAVAKTGHARYRELLDPSRPDHRPAYWGVVRSIAGASDGPAATPLAASMALLRRMGACRHRTAETACGCGGLARCAIGRGRGGLVNHHDCFTCLREGGDDDGPGRDAG